MLQVNNSDIYDFTGVEAFVNLDTLSCFSNKLTQIDISKNLKLLSLNCNSNNLVNLDVTKNVHLISLSCSGNELTNLDVSKNLSLYDLKCTSNNLTNLDVTQNVNLGIILCNMNELNDLDITQNTELFWFSCGWNNLKDLDVTKNINLERLYCPWNELDALDVTNNINLNILHCYSNEINSIDVTNNSNLTWFVCSSNHFNHLDITKNTSLAILSCSGNLLSNLDVSQNTKLRTLNCRSNQLKSLDITNNVDLVKLYCDSNELLDLDTSNNKELFLLSCANNKLVNIDCSFNSSLGDIAFDNNNELETVFIKNGTETKINIYSSLEGCPSLKFICADEIEIESISALSDGNTLVSSYCSFTPGGNYNTISGISNFDADTNGCDISDSLNSNVKLLIDDGTEQGAAYTSTSGNYNFYVNEGDFDVSVQLEHPSWFTVTPEITTISFANSENNIANQDFCIAPNGIHNDLEIVIAPLEPARPGFDAVYQITYNNKGNQELSGDIVFNYDATVLDFISSSVTVDAQTTGQLTWNYANLKPFESNSIEITLNVNSPMETPAVNNDDILNFTASISPNTADETPEDNAFDFEQIVVGSYDPNDITCLEGAMLPPTKIGAYLHYLINFENTGTAPATFVVVKDVLDVLQYNVNSIQILSASHDMSTKLSDNTLEFIFDNINLEAEGQGYVIFKIKTKNDLLTGDTVNNKTNIYFDYNFPIETNTASTLFQETLSTKHNTIDAVSIYPNPAKDVLHITSNTIINSIEVYDLQGRSVTRIECRSNHVNIKTNDLSMGIYLLKLNTINGYSFERFTKK